jgi:peptide/nickel transport system permease protein
MGQFLFKRTLRSAITMLLVLLFVFFGARATGSPFTAMFPDGLTPEEMEAYNRQFGLDKPLPVQFGLYVKNALQGDFGVSLDQRRPVTEIYGDRVGETLKLSVWALTLSISAGMLAGIVMAVRREAWYSRWLMRLISVFYSIPGFVIAILLILIFSFYLKVLPSKGGETPLHYIMPVIALSLHPIASIARYVQTSLLETISQDYIRTAVAKGIGRWKVIVRHALRNALIPAVTVIGMIITGIVSGSLVIETVFSWPGIGTTLVKAVLNRDFPMIQLGVVAFSAVVIFMNFVVDVIYMLIDPRIKVAV